MHTGKKFVHLCVDMQSMFTGETAWHLPWAKKVLPNIVALSSQYPDETIFTKFIPPARPQDAPGMWRDYFERWESMTTDKLGLDMLELDPALAAFEGCMCFSKDVYSPWHREDLQKELKRRNTDTLVISGGETDVCVLATVLGAVDLGYRVILAKDAVCSSSDEAHDAAMDLYHRRYSTQVFPMTVSEIRRIF